MTFDNAHDKAAEVIENEDPAMWVKVVAYMAHMQNCAEDASDYEDAMKDDEEKLEEKDDDQTPSASTQ